MIRLWERHDFETLAGWNPVLGIDGWRRPPTRARIRKCSGVSGDGWTELVVVKYDDLPPLAATGRPTHIAIKKGLVYLSPTPDAHYRFEIMEIKTTTKWYREYLDELQKVIACQSA